MKKKSRRVQREFGDHELCALCFLLRPGLSRRLIFDSHSWKVALEGGKRSRSPSIFNSQRKALGNPRKNPLLAPDGLTEFFAPFFLLVFLRFVYRLFVELFVLFVCLFISLFVCVYFHCIFTCMQITFLFVWLLLGCLYYFIC